MSRAFVLYGQRCRCDGDTLGAPSLSHPRRGFLIQGTSPEEPVDLTEDQRISETVRLTQIRLTDLHRAINTLQVQIAASRRMVDESREALWRAKRGLILSRDQG